MFFLSSPITRRLLLFITAFLFVMINALHNTPAIATDEKQVRSRSESEHIYLKKLAEADQAYAEGNIQNATFIRSSTKMQFLTRDHISSAPPIVDPESEKLAPAAQVYWRAAKKGIEENNNIKILISLQYLTDGYPDFLPGHLKLAEICEAEPRDCKDQAKSQQPSSAIDVLERASNLYPDNVMLLDAKLALLERMAERNETKNAFFVKLLDASIAARQYALAYPDAPDADKYQKLADRYMGSYQAKLRKSVSIYASLGAALGSSASTQQLLSLAKGENAYGEIMLNDYRKKNKFIDDPILNQYVRRIGSKLVKQIGRSDLNYQFYIDINQSNNARTFPGGIIILHSGLLQQTRTEAELAGVLSHEIAHAVLSHYYQKQAELGLMQAFSRILPLGDLFRDLTDQDYKHRQEYEADILGTRILAKSGYAADGLWSYLKSIQNLKKGIDWSQSHPGMNDRLTKLEFLIETNQYNRYSYDGVQIQQGIQNRIARILIGGIISFSNNLENNIINNKFPQYLDVKSPKQTADVLDSSQSDILLSKIPRKRTSGFIPINIIKNKENVIFDVKGANISIDGFYTLDVEISNKSDRAFGFIAIFAEVIDQNGKAVVAQFQFPSTTDRGIVVEPGTLINGKVVIPIRKWIEDNQQGIILVITEGSSGGRVFRIGL